MESEDKTRWLPWLEDMVAEPPGGSDSPFGSGYRKIAARILRNARVSAGDTVLDVGTGTGLLALTADSLVGDQGEVIGVDIDPDAVRHCRERAGQRGLTNVTFVEADAAALPLENGRVDTVICRSVLCHIVDKEPVICEWNRVLKKFGRFSFFEPIDRHETRFYQLVNFAPLGNVGAKLKAAEEALHRNPDDPLMNFDENELLQILAAEGFRGVRHRMMDRVREHPMTPPAGKTVVAHRRRRHSRSRTSLALRAASRVSSNP